jgi:RimJ/RimL family protein N-acetyltransferase
MDERFRLQTERLALRAYRREDVEDLAPMFADAEHMRHYPAPFTREQTEAWIERQLERYREDGFGLWVVEDRATGEFLGTAGPTIQVVEDVREVEIGWHVKPGRKGEGIAPEAAAAARDWAFANLEVEHVISLVRPANVASVRVAEKLGMRVDREVDYHGMRHRVYRLDRDEATIASRQRSPSRKSTIPGRRASKSAG